MRPRRRSSSSSSSGNEDQLPGTQAWRTRIQRIKEQLDANGRALLLQLEKEDDAFAPYLQALERHAESLKAAELLNYINGQLFDGQGSVESTCRWVGLEDEEFDTWDEDEDDDDDWGEEAEDEDEQVLALNFTLRWKGHGRVQIEVELMGVSDEIVVSVNGEELDNATANALQTALIVACVDELGLE